MICIQDLEAKKRNVKGGSKAKLRHINVSVRIDRVNRKFRHLTVSARKRLGERSKTVRATSRSIKEYESLKKQLSNAQNKLNGHNKLVFESKVDNMLFGVEKMLEVTMRKMQSIEKREAREVEKKVTALDRKKTGMQKSERGLRCGPITTTVYAMAMQQLVSVLVDLGVKYTKELLDKMGKMVRKKLNNSGIKDKTVSSASRYSSYDDTLSDYDDVQSYVAIEGPQAYAASRQKSKSKLRKKSTQKSRKMPTKKSNQRLRKKPTKKSNEKSKKKATKKSNVKLKKKPIKKSNRKLKKKPTRKSNQKLGQKKARKYGAESSRNVNSGGVSERMNKLMNQLKSYSADTDARFGSGAPVAISIRNSMKKHLQSSRALREKLKNVESKLGPEDRQLLYSRLDDMVNSGVGGLISSMNKIKDLEKEEKRKKARPRRSNRCVQMVPILGAIVLEKLVEVAYEVVMTVIVEHGQAIVSWVKNVFASIWSWG